MGLSFRGSIRVPNIKYPIETLIFIGSIYFGTLLGGIEDSDVTVL